MQERFHNMRPGDFGRTFVTAGDSEAKGGLRAEEATGERLGRAALAHGEIKVSGTEVSQGGAAVSSPESERKGGETGAGGKPRTGSSCPLLPWLHVSWCPLEFRRKRAKIQGVCVLQRDFFSRLFIFIRGGHGGES